jgi:hypothetical protein
LEEISVPELQVSLSALILHQWTVTNIFTVQATPQSDQCGRRKHVPRWPVSIFDLNSSLVNTKVQAAGTSLQYQAAASCSSADMLAITTLQPLTAKALILPRWYCASNYPRKFAAGRSTTRSKHASNLETQPIRRASLPWFYPSAVHPHPPT